ncbi:uncharacterized protein DS421_1g30750 [Arachis hypogaea]|nr:uncharacterized protein DS421_1g30750 [Arachis hypogaea]
MVFPCTCILSLLSLSRLPFYRCCLRLLLLLAHLFNGIKGFRPHTFHGSLMSTANLFHSRFLTPQNHVLHTLFLESALDCVGFVVVTGVMTSLLHR